MNIRYCLFFSLLLTCCLNSETLPSSDQSTRNINFCSQNLYNYGELSYIKKRRKNLNKEELDEQTKALVSRFKTNNCDVIAVQEIMSPNHNDALSVLTKLGKRLNNTDKNFIAHTAKSNDSNSKLGYLINTKKLEILKAKSYYRTLLPKLFKYDRNRYFSRGPFEIQLKTLDSKKNITVYNFHFKSKAAYYRTDKSNHSFEYDRMIMAEALNNIAEGRKKYQPNDIIILMGDRNSSYKSASEQILSGDYELADFRNKRCQVYESGESSCPNRIEDQFTSLVNSDSKVDLIGILTNKYKLIDDILVDTASLSLFLKKSRRANDYQSKVDYSWPEASDHPLLWASMTY